MCSTVCIIQYVVSGYVHGSTPNRSVQISLNISRRFSLVMRARKSSKRLKQKLGKQLSQIPRFTQSELCHDTPNRAIIVKRKRKRHQKLLHYCQKSKHSSHSHQTKDHNCRPFMFVRVGTNQQSCLSSSARHWT